VNVLGSKNRLGIVVKHPKQGSIGIEVKCLGQRGHARKLTQGLNNNAERLRERTASGSDFALRAIKIGVLAQRDARTVAKTDYVEKEFQRMRGDFQRQMEEAFGSEGQVTRKIHDVFGENGAIDSKLCEFCGASGRFEALLKEYIGEDDSSVARSTTASGRRNASS